MVGLVRAVVKLPDRPPAAHLAIAGLGQPPLRRGPFCVLVFGLRRSPGWRRVARCSLERSRRYGRFPSLLPLLCHPGPSPLRAKKNVRPTHSVPPAPRPAAPERRGECGQGDRPAGASGRCRASSVPLAPSRAWCIKCPMYPDMPEVRPLPPTIDVPPDVQRLARVVLGGAALTLMVALAIIDWALPLPEVADSAMALEAPFAVPKRADPIPVHPALVHPGWCRPANAPICQEI
jgi:hypothetical protein